MFLAPVAIVICAHVSDLHVTFFSIKRTAVQADHIPRAMNAGGSKDPLLSKEGGSDPIVRR